MDSNILVILFFQRVFETSPLNLHIYCSELTLIIKNRPEHSLNLNTTDKQLQ